MMKFGKKFNRDYDWYLSVIDRFDFDGNDQYIKDGKFMVVYSESGLSAKECFYLFDSRGVIEPTTEPDLLAKIYKTKGSVNLHIKMYAEDRANGTLPKKIFDQMCADIKAPDWFMSAVEKQKEKVTTVPKWMWERKLPPIEYYLNLPI